jgi:putative toxin-antitoxin system antitoxin component (TIGR02293 family)
MNMMQATIDHLTDARALGRRVTSGLDLVALIEEGLPLGAVDVLAEVGDLSAAELSEIVPRRSLQHARRKERLSSEQSDRVVRALGILARAHEVFGEDERANAWVKAPSRELGGQTPLSLLRTSSGTELVETLLDRIAYGVYS